MVNVTESMKQVRKFTLDRGYNTPTDSNTPLECCIAMRNLYRNYVSLPLVCNAYQLAQVNGAYLTWLAP